MDKICYVCGRPITSKLYYSHGPNTFICDNPECFEFAFWDLYSAKIAVDHSHKYPVINGCAYSIGQQPCGRIHNIVFNDGTKITTNCLWAKGKIPDSWRSKIPDNATFAAE